MLNPIDPYYWEARIRLELDHCSARSIETSNFYLVQHAIYPDGIDADTHVLCDAISKETYQL